MKIETAFVHPDELSAGFALQVHAGVMRLEADLALARVLMNLRVLRRVLVPLRAVRLVPLPVMGTGGVKVAFVARLDQMLRVLASTMRAAHSAVTSQRVMATMIQRRGGASVGKFKCYAVSTASSPPPKQAVPVFTDGGVPRPAGIRPARAIDLLPKPFGHWASNKLASYWISFHTRIIPVGVYG